MGRKDKELRAKSRVMPPSPLVLDTSPSKRIFYSIITDYDHNLGISELIDNVIDVWLKHDKKGRVEVRIQLDLDQQTITVMDNAGGVPRRRLGNIIGPGHTGNDEDEETIGFFGVGTKRAVVALSQDVTIRTRDGEKDTFEVRLDDAWLRRETWNLSYSRVEDIPPGETHVLLSRLRSPISKDTEGQLRDHLGATYARFVTTASFSIVLNGKPIMPIAFENWAFPPDYQPKGYAKELDVPGEKSVSLEMTVGLTRESSPAGGEYGVYLYCNDRLVCRGLKTYEVGFAKGLIGSPHPLISIVRAIVSLRGPAKLMPWNSTKSGINSQSKVFQLLHPLLVPVLKTYASVSRALSSSPGGWPENVFKYESGELASIELDGDLTVPDLRLPKAPRSRHSYLERIEKANESVVGLKPWARGLHEGVVAASIIFGKPLEEKNRIALIILDSTLEIGFKEYLVNEVAGGISDQRLEQLFSNRARVEQEVRNHVSISQRDASKVRYYYNLRCDLIHRKASITISDEDVKEYHRIVTRLLSKMFGLRFDLDVA